MSIVLAGGYSIIELKGSALTDVNRKKVKQDNQIDRFNGAYKWASWGDDNQLPARIVEAIEKDEVVFQSNEFNISSHYGAGINYYIEQRTPEGIIKNYKPIPEVDDWIEENDANAVFLKFVNNYETLGNIMPSIIVNRGRNAIGRLLAKDMAWSRWGKQNPDNLNKVDKLYYNSNWQNVDPRFIQDFPVLDVFDPIEDLRENITGSKIEFIYRARPFTTNRYYYNLANVEVLFNSGNLEMKDLLKAAYKSLLKNQLGVAYHIEVTEEYAKRRVSAKDHTKWESDASFRMEILEAIKKEVDDWLSGPENQGRTLLTMKFLNKQKMTYESGVTITALDDKVKQDKWLPSMQQYHTETYNAMGVDPSNTGIANKNDGMNSGSEKKNAFFNQKATLGVDRLNTLAPFGFVARFNGWTKKYPGFKWEVLDEYPHLEMTPNSNKPTNN